MHRSSNSIDYDLRKKLLRIEVKLINVNSLSSLTERTNVRFRFGQLLGLCKGRCRSNYRRRGYVTLWSRRIEKLESTNTYKPILWVYIMATEYHMVYRIFHSLLYFNAISCDNLFCWGEYHTSIAFTFERKEKTKQNDFVTIFQFTIIIFCCCGCYYVCAVATASQYTHDLETILNVVIGTHQLYTTLGAVSVSTPQYGIYTC